MNCLLIFDHLNDIVYTKYNEAFVKHMNKFAIEQEMLSKDAATTTIDVNILIQAFSPIVTSHRIMSCQFGNSYTSIECENNLTVYFEDYMGYLFLAIGEEKVDYLQRFTNICVTIVRYLCGPDVYQLKADDKKSKLTNELIDNWTKLMFYDQSMYVEAVEQLFINSDLSSISLKTLRESVDNISVQAECKKVHGLILVQNKVLSLYSSSSAKELAPSDILFLIILCQNINLPVEETLPQAKVFSYQILLSGPEDTPKCLPHAVHIMPQTNGIQFIYLVEIGNSAVAASLYESFSHLHTLQQVQIQRDKQTLQLAFENLELATKRLHDSLKKTKNVIIDNSHKQLMKKWDIIRKKYQEYLKNNSEEALLRAETLALGFLENLKQLLSLTSVDDSILNSSSKYVIQAALIVKQKLIMYEEFFKAKSIKNFSFESDSLTINKYLEEFPGLVHFLYVDRNSHRVTTPTLDLDTEEGRFNKKKYHSYLNTSHLSTTQRQLPKFIPAPLVSTRFPSNPSPLLEQLIHTSPPAAECLEATGLGSQLLLRETYFRRGLWKLVWLMLSVAKSKLQNGLMSIIWKDLNYSYAYFLWFEDSNGQALKPVIFPEEVSGWPGILCEDFYQKLRKICFPKTPPSKIRCYEVFCLHLGLVTASLVLEQTRRLTATICELRGYPPRAVDFF